MSVARARALTQQISSQSRRMMHVEMSVARARALPHYLPQTTEYLAQQRSVLSKKSPFMAIFFAIPSFISSIQKSFDYEKYFC